MCISSLYFVCHAVQCFDEESRFEDVLLAQRERDPEDLSRLVALAHAHSKLQQRNSLVTRILHEIDQSNMAEHTGCMRNLQRLAVLKSSKHSAVAQKARELIIRIQEESRHSSRKWRTLKRTNSYRDVRCLHQPIDFVAMPLQFLMHVVTSEISGFQARMVATDTMITTTTSSLRLQMELRPQHCIRWEMVTFLCRLETKSNHFALRSQIEAVFAM